MGNVAFELREEYTGTPIVDPETGEDTEERAGAFEGGTIGIPPDGEPFDVKAALDEEPHPGLIVVNSDTEPQLVQALDEQPALERTDVPEGAGTSGYGQQAAIALKQAVKDRDMTPGRRTKPELIELLQRHDRLVDLGHTADAAAAAAQDPDFDIDAAGGGTPEGE